MPENQKSAGASAESAEQELVLGSLELDQLAEAKRQRLPRRRLKRGEIFLMMSLRVYLLFMVVVVIYQIVKGIR